MGLTLHVPVPVVKQHIKILNRFTATLDGRVIREADKGGRKGRNENGNKGRRLPRESHRADPQARPPLFANVAGYAKASDTWLLGAGGGAILAT